MRVFAGSGGYRLRRGRVELQLNLRGKVRFSPDRAFALYFLPLPLFAQILSKFIYYEEGEREHCVKLPSSVLLVQTANRSLNAREDNGNPRRHSPAKRQIK